MCRTVTLSCQVHGDCHLPTFNVECTADDVFFEAADELKHDQHLGIILVSRTGTQHHLFRALQLMQQIHLHHVLSDCLADRASLVPVHDACLRCLPMAASHWAVYVSTSNKMKTP
jgi:hypothetical protein